MIGEVGMPGFAVAKLISCSPATAEVNNAEMKAAVSHVFLFGGID